MKPGARHIKADVKWLLIAAEAEATLSKVAPRPDQHGPFHYGIGEVANSVPVTGKEACRASVLCRIHRQKLLSRRSMAPWLFLLSALISEFVLCYFPLLYIFHLVMHCLWFVCCFRRIPLLSC